MLVMFRACAILWRLFLSFLITVSLLYNSHHSHGSYSPHSNVVIVLFTEAITYSCFVDLMQRMNNNFPHGGAMDTHFANMRSLIQVRHLLYSLKVV